MISDTEYARALAEFLKNKGVTRCPTVCVLPTRAKLSDADRVALRSHEATREAARKARQHQLHQIMIVPRGASQDDCAAAAGAAVSDPHSAAGASP